MKNITSSPKILVFWYLWRSHNRYLFLPGNLNGKMYLQLLQNAIHSALIQIVVNAEENETIIYQHSTVYKVHFVHPVHQFLDENFPHIWIGKREQSY